MKRALTVNEAAYLAKRSRRTIYHWIEWGVLPMTSRYIDSDDLFKAEAEMTAKIGRPRKNISKIAQEE
jgi:hypothetical protein|tara:strand:- start:354 stop:557 length:204 start_codon:yes stop_codon:yes gene_type:complete